MTFRIRLAVMSDIGAIDQMLLRSYPRLLKADYPPSVLVTALPLMTKAQPKLIMSCTYFVAEDDQGLLLGAWGWGMGDGLRTYRVACANGRKGVRIYAIS
ncbi:MAG: hypothetical protein ABJ246_02600 [Paracoccaceae bacterium]